ncbi:MAG: type VI secretion system lipoprotein TssJ [Spongiibacteraceae bacterium]|nr:type VI secretion system lipoprotein TssJ [Spongiibacteraceae bacterium]MBN4055207.1 type VI secretion system lipoprotein TssJ [bacterium AH-315-K03]
MVCILSSLLSACQSTRKLFNFDTTLTLTLSGRYDINPDQDGRSSPLVIRVLTLEDDRQIQREEFLNLFEDAKGRLGSDLLDTTVLRELAPGEEREEFLMLTPDVHYVALLAEYVRYEDAKALLILPINGYSSNRFTIDVKHLALINSNFKRKTR